MEAFLLDLRSFYGSGGRWRSPTSTPYLDLCAIMKQVMAELRGTFRLQRTAPRREDNPPMNDRFIKALGNGGSPLMNDRLFKAVGKPLERKEDLRLITGKGRFTDDFSMVNQSWAWMVRSPYPHARILAIDKTVALAMPWGVPGVSTRRRGLRRRRPEGDRPQPGTLDQVRRRAARLRMATPAGLPAAHFLLPADQRCASSAMPWRWWWPRRATRRRPPPRRWK